MDSLITAAARALTSGDPLGALNRVALRNDASALAPALKQTSFMNNVHSSLHRSISHSSSAVITKKAIAAARAFPTT